MSNKNLFEGVCHDLADCADALEDGGINNLAGRELRHAVKLIHTCRSITKQFQGTDLDELLKLSLVEKEEQG